MRLVWAILCGVRCGAHIGTTGHPPRTRHLSRCPNRALGSWRGHYEALSAQAATWAEERDRLRDGVEDARDLALCLREQLECGGADSCGCTACDLVDDLTRLARGVA